MTIQTYRHRQGNYNHISHEHHLKILVVLALGGVHVVRSQWNTINARMIAAGAAGVNHVQVARSDLPR